MHNSQRKLSWRKRLCFGLLTTIVVYGTLEMVLWLSGVRTIEEVRDPFVGFRAEIPLFVKRGDSFVTNPLRTASFNVQKFPVKKAAGAFRIFCLGGSTTFGHPYDARVAYPRALELRLQRLAPGRRFEVINCGGVSYASYRLALIVDEIVDYEPDMVIIHTGHNEFLESRTYREIRECPQWARTLIAAGAKFRTAALLTSLIDACKPSSPASVLSIDVMTVLEQTNGPQTYHRDDEMYRKVLEHLEFSQRRMHTTALRSGARVVFVSPVSDLLGMSPFKAEYSVRDPVIVARHQALLKQAEAEGAAGNLASQLGMLETAVSLDPRHAEAQWAFGSALLKQGKIPEAHSAFVTARDEDVCPLRATSDIEKLISSVARDTKSSLVDLRHHLETVCLEANGHTIIGPESFLDHVHFTIERHADLAMLLSRELAALGILKSAELSESEERDWRQELDSTISPEDRGIALHTLSMTLGWTGKNHEALRISQQAVKLTPSEGRVHTQLGRLQEKLGDRESALKAYQFAAELDAENPLVLFRLGSLLLDLGRHKEARTVLEHAARNTPANAPETFKTGVIRRLEQCR